jgi:hypothetical protein
VVFANADITKAEQAAEIIAFADYWQERAAPETLWRDFLDATGTLHIDATGVTCALNLRSHHPALIDAGFADLQTPIPWWDGRTLRFRFPPR